MSRTLLAADPGLRLLGLSAWLDGELTFAYLFNNPERQARGLKAWLAMGTVVQETLVRELPRDFWAEPPRLVFEEPQVYREVHQKGDQDDLIQLAGIVGAVGMALEHSTAESIKPNAWKGTIAKDVMLQRIESRLTPPEAQVLAKVVCPAHLRHNVVDAVGVGLWALGRLKMLRV